MIANILFATPIVLTKEEREFIKTHPKIVLGTDKSWAPFVVITDNGTITGYDQEVLNLINQVTGSNFQLKASKWSEVQSEAKDKTIDGLSTSSIHKAREDYLNFSQPYITVQSMFFTSISPNKQDIKSRDDIDGKTVGIQKGNLLEKRILSEFKNIKIIEYDNYPDIVNAVATEKIDIMIGNPSLFYIINKLELPYIRPVVPLQKRKVLLFSIRKDWPEAIAIINKALNYIGEEKLIQLRKKWFLETLIDRQPKVDFTKEERAYLKDKKEIKMCIDPNWMPLEKIERGRVVGFTSDFIRRISKKIDTPIHLVPTLTWSESLKKIEKRTCDIIPMVATTPKLKRYMNFTSSYLTLQIVLATKTSAIYINSLNSKLNETFGVVRNYALYEYLKLKYPTLKIIEVNSVNDGLKKVVKGEIFGYIDNSAVITHEIQKNFFSTIAITGKVNLEMHYGIGTRNDEKILNHIFEKAILSVNNSQKQDIKNRWFKFKQEIMIDYELIQNIVMVFLFLSLLGTTFLIILRKKNQKLKIAQKKIEKFNMTLEKQVKKEVEKNRQQQLLMFQQSRLAQMGEMISMIAHQWRQPLSNINAVVMLMDMKVSKQNIEDKLFLEEEFNDIESLTKHMSHTINDFRDFFKPEKEKIKFDLIKTIEHSIGLIKPVLVYEEIIIHRDYQENLEIYGYPNELGQVIVNIITNAKDALISDTLNKKKAIHIRLSKKDKKIRLTIQDNAGGINDKVIEHIFDPYFSTKLTKNGTGLGLYISKMIIEEHMDGELGVINGDSGAIFRMEFILNY